MLLIWDHFLRSRLLKTLSIVLMGLFLPKISPCQIFEHQRTGQLMKDSLISTSNDMLIEQPSLEEQKEIRKIFGSAWKKNQRFQKMAAGGGWSGGGGTGIACTTNVFRFNDDLLDKDGKIRSDSYSLIREIGMLDEYILSNEEYGAMNPIEKTEPFSAYFARILQPYYQINPAFFLELMQALEIVNEAYIYGETSGPLERTHDFGELTPAAQKVLSHTHCGLVQLAVRYSYRDESGQLKKVFILFDKNLVFRMGHQSRDREAYLILHEAIYLLANSANAKSVHDLTTWLMSYSTYLSFRDPKNREKLSQQLEEKLSTIRWLNHH